MKIMYIGGCDPLAAAFFERMNKEGEELYFVADRDFPKGQKAVGKRRFFRLKSDLARIFASVAPDAVVFAGTDYMDEERDADNQDDLALLASSLEQSAKTGVSRFVYLSSVQVYGDTQGVVTENTETAPVTPKGLLFAEGEYMVRLYRKKCCMRLTVLRCSEVYSQSCSYDSGDFLSRIFRQSRQDSGEERWYSPLHVNDLVDAVKRVLDGPGEGVFLAAGSAVLSRGQIRDLVDGRGEGGETEAAGAAKVRFDTEKIQRTLEWCDFKNLEELLREGKITYHGEHTVHEEKKRMRTITPLRRTVENVVVFVFFTLLQYFLRGHGLFSRIDWGVIYVVLISLTMGVRQSALAVILASAGRLAANGISILEMTNFYSYAQSVLAIIQYIFLGISVSYTVDTLKNDLGEVKKKYRALCATYEELKEIDNENILIKSEYEKRVLESRNGLSRLYALISRLSALEPDRIFMEVLLVVSEMMETDTVAVYKKKPGSPHARLINALNEQSAVGGNSWNMSEIPGLEQTLEEGKIYTGNVWKQEPAAVAPIMDREVCTAVIVIQKLSFTSQSLYHMNTLRTLTAIVSESVMRALRYEEATNREQYYEDTYVFNPAAFRRQLALAKEKEEKKLAPYALLRLTAETGLKETYRRIADLYRSVDVLGMDEERHLYLLLANTAGDECETVIRRMAAVGVNAIVVKQRG